LIFTSFQITARIHAGHYLGMAHNLRRNVLRCNRYSLSFSYFPVRNVKLGITGAEITEGEVVSEVVVTVVLSIGSMTLPVAWISAQLEHTNNTAKKTNGANLANLVLTCFYTPVAFRWFDFGVFIFNLSKTITQPQCKGYIPEDDFSPNKRSAVKEYLQLWHLKP